ncbi:MAG TPA: tetratricopeptide repeat protein [Chthoniobacterales bacterium]|nr:tetratricopeptide repeat protein [Chthoniobacterales bacterium]
MNVRNSSATLVCLVANFGLATTAFAQSEAEFSKANQEYAAGHYKEAIDTYEQVVRAGAFSANLFYDLGNAYFHTGDFGHAILNYERALALDRHHPEAQANLRIARDEARALEMSPGKAEHFAEFASTNQYAIAAAAGFWVAILCFAGWMFSRRRSGGILAWSLLSLLICALAITAVLLIGNGSTGGGFAIIVGGETPVRLATADTAQSVSVLPAGSEIKILSKRGDWIFAELPNDLRGWIPAKSAELVRL